MFLPTTFPILIPRTPIIAKTLNAYFTYTFSELNLQSRKTSVNYEKEKIIMMMIMIVMMVMMMKMIRWDEIGCSSG